MRAFSTFLVTLLLTAFASTGINGLTSVAFANPFQADEVAQAKNEAKQDKESAEETSDDIVTDTKSAVVPAPEIDDQFLRFQMWDGTVVSGIVSIASIDVETEFGKLVIPIRRLTEFRPGLVSLPQIQSKVQTLVEQLGDREFKTRESAHKELVAMGSIIGELISGFDDGGDAERRKHLKEIEAEITAIMEESEDENEDSAAPSVSTGDTIVTPEFSMIGKIQQQQFSVKSKIGDLRIMLSDIKRADRGDVRKSQVIRKNFSVAGDTFFQKKPMSTKIRVSKGDRIKISATGVVQWTNWSKTSTPDGLPNQGNWNGINNGALSARIGNSGTVISVGSDGEFIAKKSGVLYLAVAMADNYVNNSGYKWTGKFKAKVKIEPAE
jgi:hypothetical protein